MMTTNTTFSLWEQAFTSGPVALYTMYFVDSTGLGVQLDGTLESPPPFIPQWSDELRGDGRHCRPSSARGASSSDD